MTQVVLDSTNLEAIVKDATGEGLQPPELPMESGVVATIEAAKGDLKPAAETVAIDPATDDLEGEDGLTPREKRELTEKMQKAIAKRTRALREAEEFAAEQYNNRRLAEAKALQLEQEIAALKKPASEVAKPPAEPPKRENYKSEDEYRDAQIDYAVEQRLKLQAEKDAQKAAEKRQADLIATASARIAHAIEVVPDFAEVTSAVDMEVPPMVASYMQKSAMFAELGYHLAKHREVLTRLQNLPPDEQLVEIGEIKSKLQPFPTTKDGKAQDDKPDGSPKPSPTNGATPSTETGESPSPRASAPVIRPLSSGGASQVDKPEAEMTAKEALTAWQKKKHVNLTRRSRH